MKPELLQILACVECGGTYEKAAAVLVCRTCGNSIPLLADKPLFSEVPADLQPAAQRTRGGEADTPWRNANRLFLATQVNKLRPGARVLDVGAGQGDFAELFANQHYFAVDIYPYPAVDMVCDIAGAHPFRPGSLDVIVLANVIEHVRDARALLASLEPLLRPGGELWITVPFLIKIHQAPYDFARYTEYLLRQFGAELGCEVIQLDGYYDPVFLIGESQRYLRYWSLPALSRPRRLLTVLYLRLVNLLTRYWLQPLVGPGRLHSVTEAHHPAPVGYVVIYRKAD